MLLPILGSIALCCVAVGLITLRGTRTDRIVAPVVASSPVPALWAIMAVTYSNGAAIVCTLFSYLAVVSSGVMGAVLKKHFDKVSKKTYIKMNLQEPVHLQKALKWLKFTIFDDGTYEEGLYLRSRRTKEEMRFKILSDVQHLKLPQLLRNCTPEELIKLTDKAWSLGMNASDEDLLDLLKKYQELSLTDRIILTVDKASNIIHHPVSTLALYLSPFIVSVMAAVVAYRLASRKAKENKLESIEKKATLITRVVRFMTAILAICGLVVAAPGISEAIREMLQLFSLFKIIKDAVKEQKDEKKKAPKEFHGVGFLSDEKAEKAESRDDSNEQNAIPAFPPLPMERKAYVFITNACPFDHPIHEWIMRSKNLNECNGAINYVQMYASRFKLERILKTGLYSCWQNYANECIKHFGGQKDIFEFLDDKDNEAYLKYIAPERQKTSRFHPQYDESVNLNSPGVLEKDEDEIDPKETADAVHTALELSGLHKDESISFLVRVSTCCKLAWGQFKKFVREHPAISALACALIFGSVVGLFFAILEHKYSSVSRATRKLKRKFNQHVSRLPWSEGEDLESRPAATSVKKKIHRPKRFLSLKTAEGKTLHMVYYLPQKAFIVENHVVRPGVYGLVAATPGGFKPLNWDQIKQGNMKSCYLAHVKETESLEARKTVGVHKKKNNRRDIGESETPPTTDDSSYYNLTPVTRYHELYTDEDITDESYDYENEPYEDFYYDHEDDFGAQDEFDEEQEEREYQRFLWKTYGDGGRDDGRESLKTPDPSIKNKSVPTASPNPPPEPAPAVPLTITTVLKTAPNKALPETPKKQNKKQKEKEKTSIVPVSQPQKLQFVHPAQIRVENGKPHFITPKPLGLEALFPENPSIQIDKIRKAIVPLYTSEGAFVCNGVGAGNHLMTVGHAVLPHETLYYKSHDNNNNVPSKLVALKQTLSEKDLTTDMVTYNKPPGCLSLGLVHGDIYHTKAMFFSYWLEPGSTGEPEFRVACTPITASWKGETRFGTHYGSSIKGCCGGAIVVDNKLAGIHRLGDEVAGNQFIKITPGIAARVTEQAK